MARKRLLTREPLVTRKLVEPNVYDVFFAGEVLGTVRYDPDAYSYGRWFIDGETPEKVPTGVLGRRMRRVGYRTLADAVRTVEHFQSARIISLLCKTS